jgi:hypothetical protein
MWIVFCFDDTCFQGIGILQKLPTLFGHESFIENHQIF